jgi:phosphopantothenoylcysteine decarboxylase/phosphopantothenate--cysteine ligase
MRDATTQAFESTDALIMTAAVLDFRPREVSSSKIKKSADGLVLDLAPTEDFLVELGARKGDRVVVGFAMETEDGLANARGKLEAKHLDLIVLNDLTVEGAGFGVDTNVVTLIGRDGPPEALPVMQKSDVADRILDRIGERWS